MLSAVGSFNALCFTLLPKLPGGARAKKKPDTGRQRALRIEKSNATITFLAVHHLSLPGAYNTST